jgi:response regulator of citrate/malate metabolism
MFYDYQNIIIAEDDQIISQLYKNYLVKSTRNLHVANNGIQLINIVIELLSKNEKIDLIILDDKMPLKSGLEALTILPTLEEKFNSIKVLLISGNNLSDGPGKQTQYGNICTLAKPFSLVDFDRCLECCAKNLKDLCPTKTTSDKNLDLLKKA